MQDGPAPAGPECGLRVASEAMRWVGEAYLQLLHPVLTLGRLARLARTGLGVLPVSISATGAIVHCLSRQPRRFLDEFE